MLSSLSRFEEEDGNLSEIEVDKVLSLVCHVRTKVTANDAMPCGVVLFVKLLLDVGSNVLLNVVLLKSLSCTFYGVLLHVFRHVRILDNSLAVSRGGD